MTKTYTLKLNTEGTIDETQLGALALAVGWSEWDDVFSDNIDHYTESVAGDFEGMKHEKNLVQLLNEYGEGTGWIHKQEGLYQLPIVFISHLIPYHEYIDYERKEKGKLLFGAWYALNHKKDFADFLNYFKEYMHELSTDTIGEYSAMPEPYNQALSKAYEWAEDGLFNQYLHGDRSEYGLLYEGVKFLFGEISNASLSYNRDTDTLTLETSDELVREYLAENELVSSLNEWDEATQKWETAELPSEEEIAKIFSQCLNTSKTAEIKKKKEKAEKRMKEWEERKERERIMKEKAESERTAWLQSMTK